MQLRWSHAFVQVEDLAAMLAFYTEVLGFEVTDRGEVGGRPVAFLSQVDTEHHQLAFSQGEKTPAAGRVGHFAFRVDSLVDVKALHERLRQDERVAAVRAVTHGNAWSLYFADPEGNGIEVFADSPWHVAQPQGGAWDPAASDAAIRAATRAEFAQANGFRPIEGYRAEREKQLARREAAQREQSP